MKERVQPRILRPSLGYGRMLVALATGVMLLGGYVPPNAGRPDSTGSDKASTTLRQAGVAASSTARSTDAGDLASQAATEPRPKWVCEQQTATAEPVWRGEKSLTFTFHIRNEGTADLKINARGG